VVLFGCALMAAAIDAAASTKPAEQMVPIPMYDASEKHILGYRFVPESWIVVPPHRHGDPIPIIEEQFAGQLNRTDLRILWDKDFSSSSDPYPPVCQCQLNVTYDLNDPRVNEAINPCDLKSGHAYGWVVTGDFELILSKSVSNWLEWGTRHHFLAQLNLVYIGGEMRVTKPRHSGSILVEWNVASGTYTEKICDAQPDPAECRAQMIERITPVWEWYAQTDSCTDANAVFKGVDPTILFPTSAPTKFELIGLCAERSNYHYDLRWANCTDGTPDNSDVCDGNKLEEC